MDATKSHPYVSTNIFHPYIATIYTDDLDQNL